MQNRQYVKKSDFLLNAVDATTKTNLKQKAHYYPMMIVFVEHI